MFGRKRCYLCGGKLVNGRCVECGLDNERNAQKKYRLNESSLDRKMNIRHGTAAGADPDTDRIKTDHTEKKPAAKKQSAGREREKNTTIPMEKIRERADSPVRQISAPVRPVWNSGTAGSPRAVFPRRKTSDSGRADGRKVIALIAVVVAAVTVIGEVGGIVSDSISDSGWTWDNLSWDDENYDYDYDPYEYVDAQLSDTGETYDIDLTSGEYVAGVHLPEGNYSASLTAGTGYMNITDDENGIYLYQSFGYEEEYDEVTEMDDIRLFDGAVVDFSGDGVLSLHTDTAQTQDMSYEENPVTEPVGLSAGELYVAGEDFPEGVYDITASDWTTVEYSIYLGRIYDEEELNYWQNSLWFSGGESEDTYRNVVLPAGMEISTDEAPVTLTPSPVIGSTDYDSYYDRYR